MQWKKKTQQPTEEVVKKEFKPKDTDLVFMPDDLEDESINKINWNNIAKNKINTNDKDFQELTNIYNNMRGEKVEQKVLSENVRSD